MVGGVVENQPLEVEHYCQSSAIIRIQMRSNERMLVTECINANSRIGIWKLSGVDIAASSAWYLLTTVCMLLLKTEFLCFFEKQFDCSTFCGNALLNTQRCKWWCALLQPKEKSKAHNGWQGHWRRKRMNQGQACSSHHHAEVCWAVHWKASPPQRWMSKCWTGNQGSLKINWSKHWSRPRINEFVICCISTHMPYCCSIRKQSKSWCLPCGSWQGPTAWESPMPQKLKENPAKDHWKCK